MRVSDHFPNIDTLLQGKDAERDTLKKEFEQLPTVCGDVVGTMTRQSPQREMRMHVARTRSKSVLLRSTRKATSV